ncbi:hypothetical protein [Methylobacterium planeticum]|uniref:hypothetical protein n=1 Tax=Methylobacterium planeticum TaxID=2615211 RepID=UPI001FF0249D|nr:hypothetical protein [Methylobacterium planeticum]
MSATEPKTEIIEADILVIGGGTGSGYATPEQYVTEITVADDGIVDQKAALACA